MMQISWRLALAGLLKNPWSRGFAILTISFGLVMSSLLAQLWLSFSQTIEKVNGSYFVTAYVQSSIPQEQELSIHKKIETMEGVIQVRWVGKELFIENFTKYFPGISKDLSTLDADAIPRYFRVQIKDIDAEKIKKELLAVSGIEQVDLNQNRFENLLKSLILIRGFVGLLFLGSLMTILIVFINHFRLDPLNRQKLVNTMELLGASRSTVAMPVMIGGWIEGLLSGLISALIVLIVHASFETEISRYFQATGFGFKGLSVGILLVSLMCAGMITGIVGSFWASLLVQRVPFFHRFSAKG